MVSLVILLHKKWYQKNEIDENKGIYTPIVMQTYGCTKITFPAKSTTKHWNQGSISHNKEIMYESWIGNDENC